MVELIPKDPRKAVQLQKLESNPSVYFRVIFTKTSDERGTPWFSGIDQKTFLTFEDKSPTIGMRMELDIQIRGSMERTHEYRHILSFSKPCLCLQVSVTGSISNKKENLFWGRYAY